MAIVVLGVFREKGFPKAINTLIGLTSILCI